MNTTGRGEGSRVAARIRFAADADAEAIAEIYAPYVRETATSFEVEPPSSAEMRGRVAAVKAITPWLVAEQDGSVVGYAYASKHRERAAYQWSVDVAVYVARTCQRGGVGRSLYKALFGLLSAQGYYRAYAGITLPNAASIGLHEALGFTPVGVYLSVGYKLGRWNDVGWWQKSLRDDVETPKPPVALREFLVTEAGRGFAREWGLG